MYVTPDRTDNELVHEALIDFAARLRGAANNCVKAAKTYNDPDAQRLYRDAKRAEELAVAYGPGGSRKI